MPHTSRKFFQFIHTVKSYRRCWMLDLPSFWANIKTLLAGRSQQCDNHSATLPHTCSDKQVCVQLPTYADNVASPAFARRGRRSPTVQQSINISCPHQRAQADGQSDTVPLHKPCSTYYAGSANKVVWVESEYPRKFYKHLIMYFRFYG